MSSHSFTPIEPDFSADARPSNPVLFETGDWRLYGHLDDEYSTMAHKCHKWADGGNWSGGVHGMGNDAPEWRWFWGTEDCRRCHTPIPDDIKGLHLLHNFDRISERTK